MDCVSEQNSVRFSCCGKLKNDHFSQSGQSWSPICYANNNCQINPNATIGWRGCALTSLATLINHYAERYPELNILPTNPNLLNDYLKKLPNNSGYSPDNDVNFGAIEKYTKENMIYIGGFDVGEFHHKEVLLAMADDMILFGEPLIFKIGKHFVMVIGKCRDKYIVADPAGGKELFYSPKDGSLYEAPDIFIRKRKFEGIRLFYFY